MSMSIPASPNGPKIDAATPGWSGTRRIVTLATSVSCAMARTFWRISILFCLAMIVPGSLSNVDRTRISIEYASPISTARGCITRAPAEASSSISS